VNRRLRVVNTAGLAHGEARVFELERDGEKLAGFVIRHGTGLFAYANVCPHWHIDLDLGDGHFYAADVDRIFCKNHAALFRVEDGVCDFGPCIGDALQSFRVEPDGEDAWVEVNP